MPVVLAIMELIRARVLKYKNVLLTVLEVVKSNHTASFLVFSRISMRIILVEMSDQ